MAETQQIGCIRERHVGLTKGPLGNNRIDFAFVRDSLDDGVNVIDTALISQRFETVAPFRAAAALW